MKHHHYGFDAFDDNLFTSSDSFDPTGDAIDLSGPITITITTPAPLAEMPSAQVVSAQAPGSFSGEFSDLNASLVQPNVPAFEPIGSLASLAHPISGAGGGTTSSAVNSGGATGAQVQQALNEGSLSVNGSGIKVGVISDSFNDLGGAAADEADGALPSASNIQVLEDLSSGGTDEGRAMMQIIHDIAPGASLAFYTADISEQDFANGILALAAAGCKVICDDVSYFDEPFFQNGIVAQAIQTVEAEGVTYITAAGNNASNAYQAAWTPTSGTLGIYNFPDAEKFGSGVTLNITVSASTSEPVPLLLEWNQAYGQATADLALYVFQNGKYLTSATNGSVGEPTNPWTGIELTASGTYQIVIDNLSGSSDPTLIKLIAAGDGLPVTISGANSGTVYGHAMTPGVITAGAVSAASTPAFGINPAQSEVFSSSGAGTELLFANNGAALSSPELLSPVVVSGLDDIVTTVSGNLSDFYGTSAASASLAGVAALILAADPQLTPAQVEQIMEETALPMSNSAVSGAGLVNVDEAVATASSVTTVISAFGSTSLAETGRDYFLDPIGGGTGPELKYGGTLVTPGEFVVGGSTWAPIGAQATATGYEVAWRLGTTNTYSVWATDSNGNYTSNLYMPGPGNSLALEALETSFHQDLNGDGTIGIPAPIQIDSNAFGSIGLVETGGNYFLENVSTGTGPELYYQGTPVAPNEFAVGGSTYEPIGAALTATGYEVAWRLGNTNTYSVWATDANGHYTSNLYLPGPGNSLALETLETSFHQDLNGDGTIGIPAPIQTDSNAFGSIGLVETGGNYFLENVSTGTGPELYYQGTPVAPNEFAVGGSTYEPIGAALTATGYEVAFRLGSTNEFSVWATDANGNYTSNLYLPGPGNSLALETLENSFHQDLNGDGTIGIPAPIQTDTNSFGSISLVETGGNYFLENVSTGTGPELYHQGTPVAPNEFAVGGSTYEPIGAALTATGYEVAWRLGNTDTYSVWATDGNGNYTSNLYVPGPGNSPALEALETSFHQDLNGDGTIGIPAGQSSVANSATSDSLSLSNSVLVSSTGGDSFVFSSGGSRANFVSTADMQHADITLSPGGQFGALIAGAQAAGSQLVLHSANGSHNALTDQFGHDSLNATPSVHWADLHAHDFMIR